ncbi:unannotated protein [freshwater metagenome]|uniref:Unannotated protein n=1 Tax=freshwater metagenome TaxID=449393 RepID=A0A6J6I593_9ZZZZ
MFVAGIVVARCHIGVDQNRRSLVGLDHLLNEVVVSTTVHDHDVGILHGELVAGAGFKRVRVLVDVVDQRGNGGLFAGDLVGDVAPNIGAGHDLDWAGALLPTGLLGAAGEGQCSK